MRMSLNARQAETLPLGRRPGRREGGVDRGEHDGRAPRLRW